MINCFRSADMETWFEATSQCFPSVASKLCRVEPVNVMCSLSVNVNMNSHIAQQPQPLTPVSANIHHTEQFRCATTPLLLLLYNFPLSSTINVFQIWHAGCESKKSEKCWLSLRKLPDLTDSR